MRYDGKLEFEESVPYDAPVGFNSVHYNDPVRYDGMMFPRLIVNLKRAIFVTLDRLESWITKTVNENSVNKRG